MIENYTIEPNTEAILPAKLKAGIEQSGKVMMINRTATGFEKTGAIVCNTITVPEGGQVPLVHPSQWREMHVGDSQTGGLQEQGQVLGIIQQTGGKPSGFRSGGKRRVSVEAVPPSNQ